MHRLGFAILLLAVLGLAPGCNCSTPVNPDGGDGGGAGGGAGGGGGGDLDGGGGGGGDLDGGADAGTCLDADGDDYGIGAACLGLDCDDTDAGITDTGDVGCYGGPANTEGVGTCVGGTAMCTAGVPGTCMGEITPAAEVCDGLDNDCNGMDDDGLVPRACYTGPRTTEGVGVCVGGTETCGGGSWGTCVGEVTPVAEVCGNSQDDDCDGMTDEAPCATDTYVCDSCPGASDANPGTMANPVKTITQGIANAVALKQGVVFVAGSYMGTAMSYSEDVTLADGVIVQGKWAVTPAGPTLAWNHNLGARTVVNATSATGLQSPAGVTRSGGIDGLTLRQAPMSAARLAGATITSSAPLFKDFDVEPPVGVSAIVVANVGVDITGTAIQRANPRFEGASGSGNASTITSGFGTAISAGVNSQFATLEMQYVDVTAGNAGAAGTSIGGILSDPAGSSVQNSRFSSSLTQRCVGLSLTGNVAGVQLDTIVANGCPRPAGAIAAGNVSAGVVFDACTAAPGGAPPRLQNSSVSGGVAVGLNSLVVGVSASDGCAPNIDGNNITGSGGAVGGADPQLSIGVLCTYEGIVNKTGADSPCRIADNNIQGGFSAGTPLVAGIACTGTCGSSNANCTGSCSEVVGNSVVAATGQVTVHVSLDQSSPALRNNRIGLGGNGSFCPATSSVIGLRLKGSASRIANNFIIGGPCGSAEGVHLEMERRTGDNSLPSPNLNSNTIVASTPGTAVPRVSVGVGLDGPAISLSRMQAGVFRNNVITASPTSGALGSLTAGVSEAGLQVDPVEFVNNLISVPSSSGTAPLYRNEGTTMLTTPAAINALTDMTSMGNLTGNPAFVSNFDFHLTNTSAARAAGASAQAPTTDIDGDARPNPTGSNPDCGADEVP